MRPAAQAWPLKAEEDLEAIRSLRANPQLTGVVAFHAQQRGEKCLKAVAEERKGTSVALTHRAPRQTAPL
jgi:HEPN domain-containing protein